MDCPANVIHTYIHIHCAHFRKNDGSGQVRSRERACWPYLRKVYNHVRARVFHGAISSLQVFLTISVCVICLPQNLYICDLMSGESRDLTLQAYGKILKCVLLRVNESKPPNSFTIMPNYLISNDLMAFTDRGTGKSHLRSCEIINGF